ncbi:SLC13 family permease [Butyrivibrio sp. XPD2002]|uniref:SLC13 family permease n=1 Tax=Butyrivibrio sp. XPD2002 TaxID=1280665 RepID=UPI0004144FF7|nr:SLC13 family permease [Butyrivibrio sp. XPD2002]
MKKISVKNYLRKIVSDPVLVIAWILAIISAFVVRPDAGYLEYVDFRSLGILWGLMIVIQGFRENSIFEKIGEKLLGKVTTGRQLAIVLILMCFLGSMFITNDVALITFVPFALMTLHSCRREDMMISVIVLQTVAANLGSMLTPIGNPQNLYLYGLTGMSIGSFIMCMLPYSIFSLVLLMIASFFIRNGKGSLGERKDNYQVVKSFGSKKQVAVYSVLFVLALLTVLRVLPWYVMALIILAVVAVMDGKILLRADYILLLTFIGFFIFTGNMGRIPAVRDFLQSVSDGREFLIALIASQFISNVPATLMLSGFVSDYKELLIGVNVGGLGTLIASMASLISFKAYGNDYKEKRGKYIIAFTIVNVVFLVALILFKLIIG